MFNDKRHYYVCSFGGCGSWMLCNYLNQFGHIYHIHTRYPPSKLTYAVPSDDSSDYCFGDVPIPNNELPNYYVIYIYRNPVAAIKSRFQAPEHLRHIGCNPGITVKQVLYSNRDLYALSHFYNNYSTPKQNYKILFVRYESFFENISMFNKILRIPDIKELYITKKETSRNSNNQPQLERIYSDLIKRMERNPPFMLL